MTGEAIISVSAAVVALTQLAKWAGLPDRWGPVAVMGFSALGVALWVFTVGVYDRNATFSIFAGWIAVTTSAAGVFGFTRAGAAAVTAVRPPSSSAAGGSPTTP